jgi:hypothetical protein
MHRFGATVIAGRNAPADQQLNKKIDVRESLFD